MKTIYGYIGVFIAACLFQACESDLDKAYYSDGQALPAVLEALPETYAIDKLQQDEVALTFKWSEPQMGYNASITNNLEMDMKGDNNFGDKKVILSSVVGHTTTASFTNKELNDYILTLFKNYADQAGVYTIRNVSLEFRVTSTISDAKTALVSNIITSAIVPYDNENTGYEAAVINSTGIEDELILLADKKAEIALPLTWQEAYLGDNASINYSIEMNLPEANGDYNWSKKTTVLTTKEAYCNLTHQNLNDALISLLAKYGKEVDKTKISLSVSATKSGYIKTMASDPLDVIITPYVVAPTLTVPESMNLTSGINSLTWSAVEGAKYQVEMDVNGASFSQRTVLGTALTDSELTIDNAAVSKAIQYLLITYNNVSTLSATQQIDFRVRAYFGNTETGILSETKTVSVTYDDSKQTPATFYLIGKYCGWNHEESQKLYKTDSGSYKGYIMAYNLSEEGWKITDQSNWGNNQWGAPINNGIMTSGGGSSNVTSYGGNNNTSYTMEFNPNDGRLTMSNEEKSWMLLGDHNNNSFNDESKMTIVYDKSNAKWYLQKKNVSMQAGNTWQIRSQILNMAVTPQNIEGHFETDATNEGKFTISQTGTYEVRWYFNEPTPYLIVIKE